MSLGPSGVPTGASTSPPANDPRVPVILRVRRGAGWFLTIAVLSGVNTLLQAFDAKIRFIFGLGITQVVDAIAHRSGQNGMIMMIAVDGLFIRGAVKRRPSGRGYKAPLTYLMRRLLLFDVSLEHVDWRTTTTGSKVRR